MKVAYLIVAHNNPQVLRRSIRTLSFEDHEAGYFIHLDRKTPAENFSSVVGPNIHFSEERVPVYWAEFSVVEAILCLMRQALASPNDYRYCVLISSSCYPLRTGKYIRSFLEENHDLEFMDIVKVPGPGVPLSKIDTIRFPSAEPARRFMFRALAKIGLARRDHRKYLPGLDPYGGECWWALSREACQYVLDFVSINPHVEKYFRRTFSPDETFFHTILGNSQFRDRMRRNLLYIDWNIPGAHPAVISEEHVEFFGAHDKVTRNDIYGPGELLFARKFSDARLDLIKSVDEMIQRKEGVILPPLAP